MQVDCVICDTHLARLYHEPMNIRCPCHTRVCRTCMEVGHLKKCPTCRSEVQRPLRMDHAFQKRLEEFYGEKTVSCEGCGHDVLVSRIRKHELRCSLFLSKRLNLLRKDCMSLRRVIRENDRRTHDVFHRLSVTRDILAGEREIMQRMRISIAKDRNYFLRQSERMQKAVTRLTTRFHRATTVPHRHLLRANIESSRRPAVIDFASSSNPPPTDDISSVTTPLPPSPVDTSDRDRPRIALDVTQ